MTARHFLRHLALAYNHFHPVEEHKKFEESMESFEHKQLKGEIMEHLESLEKRCHSMMTGQASEELLRLMIRIRALHRKIQSS